MAAAAQELRDYLSERGGRVDVVVTKLVGPWDPESRATHAARITAELDEVGIVVEPPLAECGPDTTIHLRLAELPAVPQEPAAEPPPAEPVAVEEPPPAEPAAPAPPPAAPSVPAPPPTASGVPAPPPATPSVPAPPPAADPVPPAQESAPPESAPPESAPPAADEPAAPAASRPAAGIGRLRDAASGVRLPAAARKPRVLAAGAAAFLVVLLLVVVLGSGGSDEKDGKDSLLSGPDTEQTRFCDSADGQALTDAEYLALERPDRLEQATERILQRARKAPAGADCAVLALNTLVDRWAQSADPERARTEVKRIRSFQRQAQLMRPTT